MSDDPFHPVNLRVSYTDAVAGARKTRSAIEHALKRARDGASTVLVMPTLKLIEEMRKFATGHGVPVVEITSETSDKVRQDLLEHIVEARAGHLLFITHEAFWRITDKDWPEKSSNFHLIFDETPEILLTRNPFQLRYSYRFVLSFLKVSEIDGDYYRVSGNPSDNPDDPLQWVRFRASMHAREQDEIYDLIAPIPQWIMQGAELFTAKKAWRSMLKEDTDPNRHRGQVTIAGFRRPDSLAKFRSVTVLSALFTHTVTYHLWSRLGVKFVRTTDIKQRQTSLGKRKLQIYWLSDQGWSKKVRDRSGGITKVLDLIKDAGVINPEQSVCAVVNKDDTEQDPAVVKKVFNNAIILPHNTRGRNDWRHEHQLIYLPALNSFTSDIRWVESLGIDADKQRIARVGQDAYQTLMRLSLREPSERANVTVVVVDKDVAEWLSQWFSPEAQVEVSEIDSRGVIWRKRGSGRQGGRPKSDSALSNAERQRRFKERRAHLKLVVDNESQ